MEQETAVWIKKEEPDVLPNEPGTMFLQDPLQIEQPSHHVKQEVELKVDLDGSEQKFLSDPLGGYSSTDHLNGHSGLNFGWDENEINNAVPNTLLHTILEAESECCPPPLLVPEKELFPDDTWGISCLSDFIKEDPELNFEADETENIFLGDPLCIEDRGLHMKEDPELQLDVDGYEHNVVASSSNASNSTRLLQSSESCHFPFEETISQGVSHSELEIGSEEATHIAIFREGEIEEKEVKDGEEESLSAPRLECSWRESKCQIFICNFCLHSFSSKYRLIVHVFEHIDGVHPPKCVCKSCGEVFPSYVSLKKHLKFSEADQESSADKEDTLDCCGEHGSFFLQDDQEDSAMDQTARQCLSNETRKSFTDKCSTLITTHNAEMQDRNDNNGASDTTGKVNAYSVSHLGKRIYKCGVCGKCFTKHTLLKRHALIHTGTRTHKCEICGKSFTQLGSLKTHALIHTGTRPYKCDSCGKSFTRLDNVKQHSLLHTGIRPHNCDVCGKSFTLLHTLRKHSLINTGTKHHKCDNCGKCFTRLGDLKQHALIHSGTIRYKCDICGNSFTPVYLKKHALIHTETQPHKCNICGKSFTMLGNLKTHTLIHTGTKPHKCNICGKSFTQLGNLKKHALIHTGTVPHKCDICDKCFTRLDHLKTHALTHTGTKPHKCDICGKYFTYLAKLKRHVLKHTGK